MLPVAPCNVNDASYVRGISHESHFSGQARYLETLEGERGCSAQSPRIVNDVSYVEIAPRRDSERFVDRSHPFDSIIWCSTPECDQSWLWASRLNRTNQVCPNCGGTWHLSYI